MSIFNEDLNTRFSTLLSPTGLSSTGVWPAGVPYDPVQVPFIDPVVRTLEQMFVGMIMPKANLDLKGFDLIYSINEATLNKEVKYLYQQGYIPSSFHFNKKDKTGIELNVNWGIPKIKLLKSDGVHRSVELILPIKNGTLTHFVFQPDTPGTNKRVTIKVQKWQLSLEVNLSLADVNAGAKRVFYPEIQKQLNKLDTTVFQIQKLFLDFEDVNLMTSNWSLTNKGANTNDGKNPDTKNKQFRDEFIFVIKGLRDQLRGTKNPYLLNAEPLKHQPYLLACTSKTTKKQSPFNPTGLTFSTTVTHKANTLNYLMMTRNKKIPALSDAGLFKVSWIEPGHNSTYIIAGNVLLNYLALAIAQSVPEVKPNYFRQDKRGVSIATVPYKGGILNLVIEPLPETNIVVIHGNFIITKTIKAGIVHETIHSWSFWKTMLTFELSGNKITTSVQQGPVGTGNDESTYQKLVDLLVASFLGLAKKVKGGYDAFYKGISGEAFTESMSSNLIKHVDQLSSTILLPTTLPGQRKSLLFKGCALQINLDT